MENILKNIVDMCEKHRNTESEEFKEFLKSLNISKRLSMFQKSMIVSMALEDYHDISVASGLESDAALDIETIYIVRFILSYVDLNKSFYPIGGDDVENMYDSGFVDYVLDVCQKDYDILTRMFENAVKLNYFTLFHGALDSIGSKKNEENVNKIAEIFNDKETVNKVLEIVQYNDPALGNIKKEIYKPLEQNK